MRSIVAVLCLLPLACAAHPESEPSRRTVSVGGQAEVSVLPDRARLTLAVDRLAPEVKSAEADVNKVVRAYLDAAKALGVEEKNLSTTGVSIQPEYVWDEKARQQKLVGYRVRREIALLVTNLDKLGDFLLSATKAGVNQVNPPLLESSKAKDIERQALAKAAEDAKAKAQVLADTLGAKLGPVRRVSSNDGGGQPPMPRMMAMAAMEKSFDSGNQQMGFAFGEIRYSATVSADFDLME